MSVRDEQVLDESCSCGASLRLTGRTYPHGYSSAYGIHEIAQTWRETHRHEFRPAPSPAPPLTVKGWIAQNRH